MHYITQYTAQVVNNRMNRIKPKYLRREKELLEKFQEFHSLPFSDQMTSLEYYCTDFGLYTSEQVASDFGKVPDPSLNEIQEAQSESILSFREVMNY